MSYWSAAFLNYDRQENKMEQHRHLMDIALKAIMDVFGDTTVDQQTTRESLEELMDEIAMLVDTLES